MGKLPLRHDKTGAHEARQQRRTRALALRIGGATYHQIARELDYSYTRAHGDVQKELDVLSAQRAEDRERLRELELARCDRLQMALAGGLQEGNPRAVVAAVRVMERRAKLLGLDAPVQTEMRVGDLDAHRTLQGKIAELFEHPVIDVAALAVVTATATAGAGNGHGDGNGSGAGGNGAGRSTAAVGAGSGRVVDTDLDPE